MMLERSVPITSAEGYLSAKSLSRNQLLFQEAWVTHIAQIPVPVPMSMIFCTSVRISHGEKEGWSGGMIEGKHYLSISSITSRTEAFPTRLNNGGMPTLGLLLRGTIPQPLPV